MINEYVFRGVACCEGGDGCEIVDKSGFGEARSSRCEDLCEGSRRTGVRMAF